MFRTCSGSTNRRPFAPAITNFGMGLGPARRLVAWLVLTLCVGSSVAAMGATNAQPASAPSSGSESVELAVDWYYTLRPGDTMIGVAERCCGSSDYADKILSYNHVDLRKPIPIGSRIRIPVQWLIKQPAEVKVSALVGTVEDDTGRNLAVGDTLVIGQWVQTATNSTVELTFADGSILELNQNSQLHFNLLSSYGDAGMVDTLLRLQRGRGLIRIQPNEGRTRFRVSTPSGIAAVRGTSFRIETRDQSLLETVTGSVNFSQSQSGTRVASEQTVEAAFGVVADAQGMTKEALLAPPQAIVVDAIRPHRPMVSWRANSAAQGYVADLYRLENARAIHVATLQPSRPMLSLVNLAPGDYQVNLRGVAASGLQGMDAQTRVVVTAEPPPPPSSKPWWLLLLLPLLAL